MKQEKILTGDVADSLKAYVGGDVVPVIRELIKRNDYSEFKLAEAIKKEVNETRNLLYRLNSLNLASFIKKKDHKIGWYIHYWTFQGNRVRTFLLNEKKARLEALKELVLREKEGALFSCINVCVDVDFDKAFDFSFRCPECGELLSQKKSGIKAKDAKNEMAVLEKEIRALKLQTEEEKEKQFGKNERLEKLEEKEKQAR